MSSNPPKREVYIYFKDCRLSKSHKLREVVERHFISLEFAGDLKGTDDGESQGKLQLPNDH